MDLKNKLLAIQQELKAPKGRNNRFGGYFYRSTEDILTALKPLLKKQKVILTITDGLELIGDRYYVKATACLEDVESETGISVSAYARETLERKKSDDSQLTGAASSYARKYALNGLFLIDDTQDADTYEDAPEEEEKPARKPREKKPDPEVADHDTYIFAEKDDNVLLIHAGDPLPEDGVEITKDQYDAATKAIATGGRNGRKKITAKQAIEQAAMMNIPEDAPEELPFDEQDEEEEKPKTRRTRRKR